MDKKDFIKQIDNDVATCKQHIKTISDIIDGYGEILSITLIERLATYRGLHCTIKIYDANNQRGGGGKRTEYKFDGVRYESATALCKHLGLSINRDSAVRVIERYQKKNPNVKIEKLETNNTK